MNIFQQHFWDWVILLGLIGAAIYTMRIIGKEQTSFKDDCYQVQFGRLQLLIPRWWSIVEQTDHLIRFARTDTRYDWQASFSYLPEQHQLPLTQLLEDKLNQQEIEFDLDVVFETDSRVLFRDSRIQEHFQEVIRVEGKASQQVMDRIYYDIYLMRGLNEAGYFIFESKSSVLNGLVEGPYFEESLAELSLLETSSA
jgi:hypothetical protein